MNIYWNYNPVISEGIAEGLPFDFDLIRRFMRFARLKGQHYNLALGRLKEKYTYCIWSCSVCCMVRNGMLFAVLPQCFADCDANAQ